MGLMIGLIWLALVERLVWDMGPNFEWVTAASVAAGMFLPRRQALFVPMVVMAVSDWMWGWSWISLFTWTGFGLMVWLGEKAGKFGGSRILKATAAALVGVTVFFLWTNLGVFVTDIWGMYERTILGLLACYVNAIPFYGRQVVSALITTPLVVGGVEGWQWWQKGGWREVSGWLFRVKSAGMGKRH